MRQAIRSNRARKPVSDGASILVPVGGWDALHSLADMPENMAPVLDNFFPEPGYVRPRNGHQVHAGGMGSSVVDSLMPYEGLTSAVSKLFAGTNGSIYDVTSAGVATVTTETGLGNNRWQWVNFTTSAAKFLWICNGTDAPRHYNGSVWAQPSLTGITATDVIHVNAHKKRLWFVLKDSTKAGYLAVDTIAGAVTTFELGSLFSKGGYLNAIGTWTRDGGAGPDDFIVFISSQGQCAVYQGIDPASNFLLIGVFDLGEPIGRRCFTKVGGDLALVNVDGVLPLSKALETDRAGAAAIAITKNINKAMNEAARLYKGNFGWEFVLYPRGNMGLLNVPVAQGSQQHQYVVNTLTGAWCRFLRQNVNCMVSFQERLYGGGNSGQVYRLDESSMDLGSPVDAIGQTAYHYFKSHGDLKRWVLLQPLITTDSEAVPSLGISTDFKDNATLSSPSSAAVEAALFDSAIFDTSVFPAESRNLSGFITVAGVGHCASVHFRARTGADSGITIWGEAVWGVDFWSNAVTDEITLRFNGFNTVYEKGGFL